MICHGEVCIKSKHSEVKCWLFFIKNKSQVSQQIYLVFLKYVSIGFDLLLEIDALFQNYHLWMQSYK